MGKEKGGGMIEVIEKNVETKNTATNEMKVEFAAISSNEAFARMVVAAFITPLNPTVEELSDVKTAVSEAVTNAIIHGYENENLVTQKVYMSCAIEGDVLEVEIRDKGVGIADIHKAMEPLYTTKPEMERSGMGFAFMEAFMDDLEVFSKPGAGTSVRMHKKIGLSSWIGCED